ncbi:MAG: SDR family NAD(P)-dependent oxidoreductase, partial [Ignavibacteria bacterium]|nr:SDR family NAD(P)-dependent oxidoreductase [Ignavibacteria bacterium]
MKNKTVLITGASSGFGKAIAEAFAKKGSRLIIAARRSAKLKETANELKKKFKTEVLTITLDVRKKNEVAKAVKSLPVKWRDIDILVNNAGLSRGLDKVHE